MPTRSHRTALVCFSHLRWDFVYQRPQHLMRRAAAQHAVIYLEEPVYEADRTAPEHRFATRALGVAVVTPLLPQGFRGQRELDWYRDLLDELLLEYDPAHTILWYYTPMALRYSGHLRSRLCVYDCMDELSAFNFAPPELTRLERSLFDQADLVFVGGSSLYEAKRAQHSRCHLFPSSVDAGHFMRARSGIPDPADQQGIAHPRAGFFGVIDERMDLPLVEQLAAARPGLQLVFLGPVVKIDPQSLPQRPNIHWLGIKSYAELPAYLAGWDLGLMPFARNAATRFISPTKTPEFLASGLPVCSTPIADVVCPYGRDGLVEIASDAVGFADQTDRLLRRGRDEWLAAVDRYLSTSSWDETWSGMQQKMHEARRETRVRSQKAAAAAATADVRSHAG